jgi:xanthine dehydrogenase accessory factor
VFYSFKRWSRGSIHHNHDVPQWFGEWGWAIAHRATWRFSCLCGWADDITGMTARPFILASRAHGTGEAFALITVVSARGSTPRERGAGMVVTHHDVAGTIGGGQLEFNAIAAARTMLNAGRTEEELIIALGPEIGQCCGGSVTLGIHRGTATDLESLRLAEERCRAENRAVIIYGSGHVGRALAKALKPLPFLTTVIDSRSEEVARLEAEGLTVLLSDRSVALAETAPAGSAHVVMTHSHALDSLIAAAVLERGDFGYLGIIGSATKRALFLKGFRDIGLAEDRLARVVCPIGGDAVRDKRPDVIAAMTAAEITIALLGGKKDGG